jgi:hypothetical protein
MKSLRFVLPLLLASVLAFAAAPNETLVGTSATLLASPHLGLSLISNNGPTDIWCAPVDSTKAVVGKGYRVQANGGSLLLPDPTGSSIYCVAPVAQVTTKATIVAGFGTGPLAVGEALYPRGYVMMPKAPTALTTVAAGEQHVQLSQVGACVRYYCTVDASFITSKSTSPVAATSSSNPLPARTVEKGCLSQANDYFSIYLSAAGTCYVSETNAP